MARVFTEESKARLREGARRGGLAPKHYTPDSRLMMRVGGSSGARVRNLNRFIKRLPDMGFGELLGEIEKNRPVNNFRPEHDRLYQIAHELLSRWDRTSGKPIDFSKLAASGGVELK